MCRWLVQKGRQNLSYGICLGRESQTIGGLGQLGAHGSVTSSTEESKHASRKQARQKQQFSGF